MLVPPKITGDDCIPTFTGHVFERDGTLMAQFKPAVTYDPRIDPFASSKYTQPQSRAKGKFFLSKETLQDVSALFDLRDRLSMDLLVDENETINEEAREAAHQQRQAALQALTR